MNFKTELLNLIRKIFRTDEIAACAHNDQFGQRNLKFFYQDLARRKAPLFSISEVGWRNFSQVDEDGILHYIFSLIGTTNKVCLDIAFASPYEANTTNLILNDGWRGILICAGKESEAAKRFFNNHPDSKICPPKIYREWITTENLNAIAKRGMSDFYLQDEDIDLLSLDVDGVEYWLWKALDAVRPRVVVVEYLSFVAERSLTVPYRHDFDRFEIDPDFMGCSLPALVKLGRQKDYRLVGCNRLGYNAFFVKNGVGDDILPEIPAKECLKFPNSIDGQKNRWPKVERLNWVEV